MEVAQPSERAHVDDLVLPEVEFVQVAQVRQRAQVFDLVLGQPQQGQLVQVGERTEVAHGVCRQIELGQRQLRVCALPGSACVCARLPHLENRTQVTLITHVRELQKTSNSGRLARRMLSNSRLLVRGLVETEDARSVVEALDAIDPARALLLFPRADAEPLDTVCDGFPRPAELVIPDGTWSQTRRLVRRHPALQRLRAVTLSTETTRYRLRRGSVPGLVCTLEGVAAALRLLEDDAIASALLRGFDDWQRAVLALRGQADSQGEPAHAISSR